MINKGMLNNPRENFIYNQNSNYPLNYSSTSNVELTQVNNSNQSSFIPYNNSNYSNINETYNTQVHQMPSYVYPSQINPTNQINNVTCNNDININQLNADTLPNNRFIYGNPIISFNQLPQTQIQQSNIILVDSFQKFKVSPTLTVCSSCKIHVITEVEKKLNVKNLLLGLSVGPILYMLFQKLRDKEISFMNAKHFCSKCKKELYQYEAC